VNGFALATMRKVSITDVRQSSVTIAIAELASTASAHHRIENVTLPFLPFKDHLILSHAHGGIIT
jgi:hypothetical protein